MSQDFQVDLLDISGKKILSTKIEKGSTIAYFDTQTLYYGTYIIVISSDSFRQMQKVLISR